MNTIEDIRTYMGGDNRDVPIYQPAVDHLQYLMDKCKENNLPLPEIFPWIGGNGVQAEWEFKNDWYIEIDSSSKGISGFFLKDGKNERYDDGINCSFNDIEDAFLFVKVFLESIVKNKGCDSLSYNEDIVLNHEDIKELLELPYVVLDEHNDEELRINGELICRHKRLYPADILKALVEYGIINFVHEK